MSRYSRQTYIPAQRTNELQADNTHLSDELQQTYQLNYHLMGTNAALQVENVRLKETIDGSLREIAHLPRQLAVFSR